MKKILLIIGCIVVFAASSCTKQYVTPPGTTNQTIYADLKTSDWTLYTVDNKSYFVSINIPQLNTGLNQFGGVIVALSYDNGATYEQLPEVYNGTAFSFTYNTGNVSIYAQSSDGAVAIQPTGAIKAKIILVDSN